MREGARLSQLQRRAHLSSLDVAAELSSLRTYRHCPKEMPGMRSGRVDLRGLRDGKSRINRRADFPERGGKTDGCRLDVAQGSLSRDVAGVSRGQDRYPGRHANDREGAA